MEDTQHIDDKILEFFNTLSEGLDTWITRIELWPIVIKRDFYLSGFRRIGVGRIEAHLLRIEKIGIESSADGKSKTLLASNPTEEMWVETDLLDASFLTIVAAKLMSDFLKLDGYEILHIEYRDKNNSGNYATQEEDIIFSDKRKACKEALAYRKKYSICKTSFKHMGEKATVEHEPTDIEIATCAAS